MPNFYTHLCFAREVSQRVSPELRERLIQEWDSFCLGNFGPDPLYFGSSQLRHGGLQIHHGTGAQALEVYRKAIQQDKPYALSFASGYFLHYFLDSRMHPLVYRAMEETSLTHRSLEGELDRMLLERDGISPMEAFPNKAMPESFYMTAARMLPGVTAQEYAASLKNFRRVSMALTGFTGTPMRHAVNAVSRIPGAYGIRGAILSRSPAPQIGPYLQEMGEIFSAALEEAPGALEQFLMDAVDDRDFSPILSCDFSGKRDV